MSAFDPDIIFTHHPFDTHQAHEGVARASIAAARRKNTVFFYEPITPSGRSYVPFKPSLYVDIEATLDLKISSLKCHKSEYNKFGAEDWIEGVRARCGYRGYEIGKKFAEAFEILRLELSFEKCYYCWVFFGYNLRSTSNIFYYCFEQFKSSLAHWRLYKNHRLLFY